MRYLSLIILFFLSGTSWGQSYQVTGKIFDHAGKTLAGAMVYIHETMQGVVSDEFGRFELKNINPGHYHLHITFIGFETIHDEIDIINANIDKHYVMAESTLEIKQYLIEESILKTREKENSLKIEIVDKRFLAKHSGFTFIHQLASLPGMHVMSTGTGIAKPVIRGFSFNRVIVADRGIKQEGQQWGWDHGLEIDAFDVERVEIIRGPVSLLYGSDAIGGVIHIRHPELLPKNSAMGAVQAVYRTANHQIGWTAQGRAQIKDISIGLRYSQQDYGDYRVPADLFIYNSYQLPLYNNRLKNTAGKERNFSTWIGLNQNWGYSIITLSRVFQKSGFFSGAHGMPQAYQLEDDGDSRNIDLPYQEIEHWKAIWNNNIHIRKGWLELDLGFQQNLRTEYSYPHSHGQDYIPDTTNIEHRFELQTFAGYLRYHINSRHAIHWIYGLNAQYQHNRSSGFSYLLPHFNWTQGGSFLYLRKEWKNNLTLNAGARIDFSYQEILRYEMPKYNQQGDVIGISLKTAGFNRFLVNGSGNIGLSWTLDSVHTLKWNIGSSFRVPAITELSANGIHHGTFRHEMGDSTLSQERGVQFDFIIDAYRKKWHLSFSPFFYYFHNYIYLRPTGQFSPLPDAGQIYQYSQANSIQTGLELQCDVHPVKNLHINTGIDYVFAINMDEGYPLPYIPPGSIKTDIEYELPIRKLWNKGTYIKIITEGVLPQFLPGKNESPTSGYFLLGLATGSTFSWKGLEIDLKAEIQNMTNQTYMVHINRYRLLNLPEPGINAIISLTFSYQNGFTLPKRANKKS